MQTFFLQSRKHAANVSSVERRENEMRMIIRDNKGFEFQGKRWSLVESYGYHESLIGWFSTRAEAQEYRAMREKFSK